MILGALFSVIPNAFVSGQKLGFRQICLRSRPVTIVADVVILQLFNVVPRMELLIPTGEKGGLRRDEWGVGNLMGNPRQRRRRARASERCLFDCSSIVQCQITNNSHRNDNTTNGTLLAHSPFGVSAQA